MIVSCIPDPILNIGEMAEDSHGTQHRMVGRDLGRYTSDRLPNEYHGRLRASQLIR